MQITAIAFQNQTIHLASYQSYQSQLIQYHPDQSTIDEAVESKKQKVSMLHQCTHFMELHLEDIYRKKSVPSEKPNMR